MDLSVLLVKVGAGSLLFTGLAHTAVELAISRRPPPPELQATANAMKSAMVKFPGREVSLFALMQGYSLMMGVVLATLGVVGWLVGTAGMDAPLALTFALGCAIGFALSLRYFFVLPITTLGLATLCFAFAAFI